MVSRAPIRPLPNMEYPGGLLVFCSEETEK
jgi:hypothetical protein